MSNDIQKADQIAYHFHTKLVLLVANARSSSENTPLNNSSTKLDKWFNIESPDSDIPDAFKDTLRIYRSLSSPSLSPPPLVLHVLLAVPDLSHNQVLVHLTSVPPNAKGTRSIIEPTPPYILLESWTLLFTPHASPTHPDQDVPPSTIYKHGITLFRSLYTLLRVLPAWGVCKHLRRRAGALATGPGFGPPIPAGGQYGNGGFGIVLRVGELDDQSVLPPSGKAPKGTGMGKIIGFDQPPLSLTTLTHSFPAIPHPGGSLSLSLHALSAPFFEIDTREAVISEDFMRAGAAAREQDDGSGTDEDERRAAANMGFTPTLTAAARERQRESLLSQPGAGSSAPSRPRITSTSAHPHTSAAPNATGRSPPRAQITSLADRFVLPHPSHVRTRTSSLASASASGSPPGHAYASAGSSPARGGGYALPMVRAGSTSAAHAYGPTHAHVPGASSGLSVASASSSTRDDLAGAGRGRAEGVAARYRERKESSGAGRGYADLPSLPSSPSLPIRSARPAIQPIPLPSSASSSPSHLPTSTSAAIVNPFKSSTLSSAAGSPSLASIISAASVAREHTLVHTGASVHSIYSATSGQSASPAGAGGRQPSPLSARAPAPPSPIAARPAPASASPLQPSSLDRRSLTSSPGTGPGSGGGAGDTDQLAHSPLSSAGRPGRKRYSSSFGHRYAGSVGGSEGSAGSAGAGAAVGGAGAAGGVAIGGTGAGLGLAIGEGGERPANASFLSTTTDDDDISAFVKDIDARKPLMGRASRIIREESGSALGSGSGAERSGATIEEGQDREARGDGNGDDTRVVDEAGQTATSGGSPSVAEHGRAHTRTSSSALGRFASAAPGGDTGSSGARDEDAGVSGTSVGAVLTSETEVDEQLRRMNEVFRASLEGLGGGSTRRRREGEAPSFSATGDLVRATSGQHRLSLSRPPPTPLSGRSSVQGEGAVAGSTGSDEVVGRLSIGEEWRRSRKSSLSR